jgi:hypothetical protein
VSESLSLRQNRSNKLQQFTAIFGQYRTTCRTMRHGARTLPPPPPRLQSRPSRGSPHIRIRRTEERLDPVRVVTIPTLVMLKLVAHRDRRKTDDLADVLFILENYSRYELEDRIFDELADQLASGELPFEHAGGLSCSGATWPPSAARPIAPRWPLFWMISSASGIGCGTGSMTVQSVAACVRLSWISQTGRNRHRHVAPENRQGL